MRKLLRYNVLSAATVVAVLASPIPNHSQATPKHLPMWKEARRPAAKGTRIPVPTDVLDAILADQSGQVEELGEPCNSKEQRRMDAFRVTLNGRKPVAAISVWAKNACYCSPTGNCRFWLIVTEPSDYRPLLVTDMVRDFGFLKARTNGYRDLVVWSHDSAQRSPARLFQFDGKEYEDVCGWEEDYEFKELPNGRWVPAGDPKIVDSNCERLPSTEESKP